MSYLQKIKKAVSFIKGETDFQPQFGIVLGTGLGALARQIDASKIHLHHPLSKHGGYEISQKHSQQCWALKTGRTL